MHSYPQRFTEYAELTTLRILEAHKDSEKEVARAAEEAAATLATVLPRETSVRVLRPIVETSEFPVDYAAIKMLQKVIETMTGEEVRKVIPEIIGGLIKVSRVITTICSDIYVILITDMIDIRWQSGGANLSRK